MEGGACRVASVLECTEHKKNGRSLCPRGDSVPLNTQGKLDLQSPEAEVVQRLHLGFPEAKKS